MILWHPGFGRSGLLRKTSWCPTFRGKCDKHHNIINDYYHLANLVPLFSQVSKQIPHINVDYIAWKYTTFTQNPVNIWTHTHADFCKWVKCWPASLGVLGSISAADRNLFSCKQGSIAHSLSLSPSHHPDIYLKCILEDVKLQVVHLSNIF